MKGSVLLIEDDDAMRLSLAQTLELEGIVVIQASGLQYAKRAIRANFAGIVLSDIRMPVHDGFDVLSHVHSIDPELPVIMLTGEADIPMALRALKNGAYDFLEKPCPTDRLLDAISRALAHRALVTKSRLMTQKLKRLDPAAQNFPGECTAIQDFKDHLRSLSNILADVHFYGEYGVGKKLAAYTLHSMSLAMFPDREGAVSFNLQIHQGSILQALPERANLDLTLKNIDFASPSQLTEIASLKDHRSGLRLFTTSTSNWENNAERLNTLVLSEMPEPVDLLVPNLDQRRSDLPIIFENLMRAHARNLNIDQPQIPVETISEISQQAWTGNINELRHHAKRVLLAISGQNANSKPLTLADRMNVYEYQVLNETLDHFKGNVVKTAQTLGLPKKTLYDRLARHGIKPKEFR